LVLPRHKTVVPRRANGNAPSIQTIDGLTETFQKVFHKVFKFLALHFVQLFLYGRHRRVELAVAACRFLDAF
jgi:hypothetical protein